MHWICQNVAIALARLVGEHMGWYDCVCWIIVLFFFLFSFRLLILPLAAQMVYTQKEGYCSFETWLGEVLAPVSSIHHSNTWMFTKNLTIQCTIKITVVHFSNSVLSILIHCHAWMYVPLQEWVKTEEKEILQHQEHLYIYSSYTTLERFLML
jgi:hypothetical protein